MAKPNVNMFAALSLDNDSGYDGDTADSPTSTEGSAPQIFSNRSPSNKLTTSETNKDNHEPANAQQKDDARTKTETPFRSKAFAFDEHRSKYFIPPGKWRDHNKEQIAQHRVQTGVLPATAKLGTGETVLPHGSRQDAFDETSDRRAGFRNLQTKGTIVRHLDLHHFPDGGAPADQGNVLTASDNSTILAKPRFFLIIGRKGDRITECPIYTFGGLGLKNRDKATWYEYCSIKPKHLHWREDFHNQSPDREVLDVEWMDWNVNLKDAMVVRLSDVRHREIGHGAQIVASISREAQEYAAKVAIELLTETVAPVKG